MDESARLAALRSYRILDTDAEAGFDDLALLAAHICGTPIALISLVDERRQWFKARVGISVSETERSISFCAHAIEQPEIMVVPNALEDQRFRQNPMVQGEPHIRFYAGAPIALALLLLPSIAAACPVCAADNGQGTLKLLAVFLAVPAQAGNPEATLRRELRAFTRLQVWLALLIGAIGFGGFFAVYTFVSPMVTEVTGLPSGRFRWRSSSWASA